MSPAAGHSYETLKEILSSILVIETDLTKERHLQVQLLHSQRLQLVETLAAGIARDLDSFLRVIITNLDLANNASTFDKKLSRYLGDAIRGAKRATGLSRRLLNFSSREALDKHPLDIAEVLISGVLVALSGSKLKPFFTIQQKLHPVMGDGVLLAQVFENLVINACEAASQAGKLLVRAENVENPARDTGRGSQN